MNISLELYKETSIRKIPLYTTLELTYRCNLNCIHCYIPDNRRYISEMGTSVVKNIIYEIAKMGGLYLVFTGGEPLLREDIFELISYAKKLNFVVILFTNGSLIDENVAKMLSKLHVDKIEISIYGKQATHDKFVQKKVFHKVITGIELLNSYNLCVSIKTVLTKYNIDDYSYIKKLAKKLNIMLKTDFVVTPKNDGDFTPVKFMLEKKDITKILSQIYNSKQIFLQCKNSTFNQRLICSAGVNMINIAPNGDVYPCVQMPYLLGNIYRRDLRSILTKTNFENKIKNLKFYKKCLLCKLMNYCNRCPGICYVETKNLYGCSKIIKTIAETVKQICDFSHIC